MKGTLMQKPLTSVILILVIAFAVSPAGAMQKSIAGAWTLSAEGLSLSLVLTQEGNDGTAVTGTLEDPHGGIIPLKGEFAGDRLTVSGSSDGGHGFQVTLAGTIQRDGSLAGSLTSTIRDMSWTAVRVAR